MHDAHRSATAGVNARARPHRGEGRSQSIARPEGARKRKGERESGFTGEECVGKARGCTGGGQGRARAIMPNGSRTARSSRPHRPPPSAGREIRIPESYIVILQPTVTPYEMLSSVLKGYKPTFTYSSIFTGFAVDRVPMQKADEVSERECCRWWCRPPPPSCW